MTDLVDIMTPKILMVLPMEVLPKVDCKARYKKDSLVIELDAYLEKVKNGISFKERMVNTCIGLGPDRNSNPHYFLIAVVNKMLKKGLFKSLGVGVYINKEMTKIEFESEVGDMFFFYDRVVNPSCHPFKPIKVKSRLRA